MIVNIIDKIKRIEFIKNIFTLASGIIIATAINTIGLPFLSRIYTSSQIGEYDLIISSSSVIMSSMQLALMLVIMVPRDEREGIRICKLIALSTLIGTSVFLLGLLLISGKIHIFETSMDYYLAIFMMCTYIIVFNMESIYYSYVNRTKKYRVLFYTPIIIAGVNIGFSLFCGLIGFGTAGYLLGSIISQISGIVFMSIHVNPFSGRDTFSELLNTLKKYKRYPMVQLPANLIDTIANQMPTQILGRIFDYSILGGFSMATKFLNIPISLLAGPINRVYYRTLIEKINSESENPGDLAFAVVKNNIKIAIVPIGILMVFGDFITGFILGKEWKISGTYILIMGLLFLLQFCCSCLGGTFVATGKQKISLIYAIGTVIQISGTFGLTTWFEFNVVQTIIVYTISMIINRIIVLALSMYCTSYSVKKMLAFILRWLGFSAVIIYGLYVLRVFVLRI